MRPGYCHYKWFFHPCQHHHTETEMFVTQCLPLRQVFASGEAAFPCTVLPAAEWVFTGSSSPGWCVFPTTESPCRLLQSWISESRKAFPRGGTRQQAQAFSSPCLKDMHYVFLLWVCFVLNFAELHQFQSCSHSLSQFHVRQGACGAQWHFNFNYLVLFQALCKLNYCSRKLKCNWLRHCRQKHMGKKKTHWILCLLPALSPVQCLMKCWSQRQKTNTILDLAFFWSKCSYMLHMFQELPLYRTALLFTPESSKRKPASIWWYAVLVQVHKPGVLAGKVSTKRIHAEITLVP